MDRFINRRHLILWSRCRLNEALIGGSILMLFLFISSILKYNFQGSFNYIFSDTFEIISSSILVSIFSLFYYYFMCTGIFFSVFFMIVISETLGVFSVITDSVLNCLICFFIVQFLLIDMFPNQRGLSLPYIAMACFFAAHVCMHAFAAFCRYRKARRQPIA